MSPSIRLTDHSLASGGSIACPPQIQRDLKARIEKHAIVTSGKVKLRDLLGKLGGLLFWEQSTRTVTVYTANMRIEMQIGSKTVKVNGRTMRVNVAPELVNGRTIIDVGVYHRAVAFAASQSVRSAMVF